MLIVKGRPQWWWSKSLFVIKEPHKHVVHDAQGEIDRHACRMNISEKKIISEKKYHKSLLSFLRKQKMGFFFSKLQKVLFCFEIHCSLSRYTLVHLEFPKCLVCAQPGFWGPFPLLLGILLLGNMDPFFFCSLLGVIFLDSFPLLLGIVLLGNMEPFFYSHGFHIFGKLTGLSGVVSSGRWRLFRQRLLGVVLFGAWLGLGGFCFSYLAYPLPTM